MTGIKNFLFVSDRLACAGQPDESQLTALAAEGYAVVINLGLADSKYALPDEAGSLARLGLRYFHIPVLFDSPLPSQWESFAAIMDQQEGNKIFVHCAANYRATAFTGLYLFARSGVTEAGLHEFISNVWDPDPVWRRFIENVIAKIREQQV